MPLLGKRIFDGSIEPASPADDGSKPFVIQHTKEIFYSESEYKERLNLYEKPIWKCQCTGKLGMTHKEASLSEISCRERLAQSYEILWEEPVLKIVQHSFAALDNIVAQVYNMFMTRLQPGEMVEFTPKENSTYQAKVIKSLPDSEPADSNTILDDESSLNKSSNTVSPSSDKENKGRQALITDLFISGNRRSPRASTVAKTYNGSTTMFGTKEKSLKLLSLHYSILLVDENKIVDGVPVEFLTRTVKPPTKELIKLFIRSNAIRPAGMKEKVKWIVDDKMVLQYNLPSLITEEEESFLLQDATVTISKYLQELRDLKYRQEKINDCIIDCANLDDENSMLSLFNKSPVKYNGAQKRKVNSTNPVGSKRRKQDKSAKKKTGKSLTGMDLFLKKSPAQANHCTSKGPVNGTVHESILIDDALSEVAKILSPDRQTGSSRKSSSPRKKKQATILELTKKGKIKLLQSRTPSRSTPAKGSPRKPTQPTIVRQIISLKKEKNFRPHKYKTTITAACKILNKKQLLNLPAEVKEDIINKWELIECKKRFQAMTPEERKNYMRELRKNRILATNSLKPEKFEDLHLVRGGNAKSLPGFQLVSLPENLPNTLFGDIVMLCEFLHSYHSLLTPKDPTYHKQFNIQSLSDALTAGKNGYLVTSKVLIVLLQTLLVDDIAKDYSVLDYKLSMIQVTPEVCCELTRVCLRQIDEDLDDDDNSDDGIQSIDTGLSTNHLFELELYDMEPVEQVEVLTSLMYRVMNTYAVQIHMEDTSQKAANLWSTYCQKQKEKRKHDKETKKEKLTEPVDPSKKISPAIPSPMKQSPEEVDLISRVKNRKQISEKYRVEEQERKRRKDEEMLKLEQEQKKIQEEERSNKVLAESRLISQKVRRRTCLGIDRNHSRYWLFCDGAPGLYIEKGWVGDCIEYSTSTDKDDVHPLSSIASPKKTIQGSPAKSNPTDVPSSDDEDIPLAQLSPSKKKPRFRKSKEEATWPRPGQNLWMQVESPEELDSLIENLLPNGVREMRLLKSLKKHYDAIVRSINKKRSMLTQPETPNTRRSALPSDGEELHVTLLRKHMTSLVNDASRGGICELSEPDVVVQRVAIAETVQDFGQLLLDIHQTIPEKFLRQYMTGISDKTDTSSGRGKVEAECRVERWKKAVKDAVLLSRLNLLFVILNNSIKWELYQYRRPSRRAAARNKNISNSAEEVEDDEDEESDGEEEEGNDDDDDEDDDDDDDDDEENSDDDNSQRRSLRIRSRKSKRRYVSDEDEDDSVIQRRSTRSRTRTGRGENEITERRQTRGKRRNYRILNSESGSEEEDEEEEVDSDDVVDSHREEGSEQEEQEEDSDNNDEDEDGSEEEAESQASFCRRIIEKLMKYQYSEFFREPVDPEDVPDYYEIVKNPISLKDVLLHINESQDSDDDQVVERMMEDIRLVLDNALAYNQPNSFVVKEAKRMIQGFVKACRDQLDSESHQRRLKRLFESAL